MSSAYETGALPPPLVAAGAETRGRGRGRARGRGDLALYREFLLGYARPYWRSILALVAGGLVASVLGMLAPLVMAPLLDLLMGSSGAPASRGAGGVTLNNLGAHVLQLTGSGPHAGPRVILLLGAAFAAVVALKGLVDYGTYLLAVWIRVRLGRDIQRGLFHHIVHQPMTFFARHRTGDLVSRLSQDTSAAAYGLDAVLGKLVTGPILIAFYGYLLLRTSPWLALVGLVALGVHYGLSEAIKRPIRREGAEQFQVMADLASRLQEAILSVRIVKSFAAERFELARLGREMDAVVRANLRFGVYKHAEEPARRVTNGLIEAAFVVMAGMLVLRGQLTPAAFVLYLYVGRALLQPVADVMTAFVGIQSTLAATDKLRELWADNTVFHNGTRPAPRLERGISLRNVSFSYGDGRVLEDVTLDIRAGEFVALVGPSGAGKSTLADLLLRFYDPERGTIELDGVDIREFDVYAYRELFGVVPQEAMLFNDTLAANVAYSRPGTGDDEVRQAAGIANLDEVVRGLPDGFDTIVGDRGVRLSGGQRQRVAVARALVGRPQVLLLDEATSALDAEAERAVQDAIEGAIAGRTAVVIAHRLSTVVRADRIVVLNGGRVEAVGRHAELLGTSATYARLCALSFGDVEAAAEVAAD